ncbi:nuclear transport factor 2 family protein [Flavobacterium terrigena]|uniref:SnoaL-like domain-containing protein n=1 Tax=Flavobacterium terrigena TaxID=402734 RepID=A0A1H6SS16_9FLAO|nr:nuclear transport factor 2 family protein [Flavobacterium terrigena]SEI70709.1 SnoaL-like domain-containing protein [Flavobacterium terrigena]
MRKVIVVLLGLVFIGCKSAQPKSSENVKSEINLILDNWHKAAGQANFNAYFDVLTEDAIYIGTDPTENWNKQEFIKFSKPYFDRGRAWNFTALERNIYFSLDMKTVWFDELLNTQMKICRGSGVLVADANGNWKIRHYVLSMTIPNDNTDEVVKIKSLIEDKEIEKLKKGE